MRRQRMDYEDAQSGLLASFQRWDPESGAEDLSSYNDLRDGARFALAVHLHFGGEILVTPVGEKRVHQARVGGLVVDGYGARRAEDSGKDLARRFRAEPQPPIRFQSLSAYKADVRREAKAQKAESFFFPVATKVDPSEMFSRAKTALLDLGLRPGPATWGADPQAPLRRAPDDAPAPD